MDALNVLFRDEAHASLSKANANLFRKFYACDDFAAAFWCMITQGEEGACPLSGGLMLDADVFKPAQARTPPSSPSVLLCFPSPTVSSNRSERQHTPTSPKKEDHSEAAAAILTTPSRSARSRLGSPSKASTPSHSAHSGLGSPSKASTPSRGSTPATPFHRPFTTPTQITINVSPIIIVSGSCSTMDGKSIIL